MSVSPPSPARTASAAGDRRSLAGRALGGARPWHGRAQERGRVSPFSPAAFPMKLGEREGRATSMDPRLAAAAERAAPRLATR